MNLSRCCCHILGIVLGCLLAVSALHSQTPGTAAASSPWRQLEATYQTELKKIHVPLLSAYITELSRLAAQSRNAEVTTAISQELRHIQTIIGSGGVVDLAQPLDAPDNPPPPRPPRPASETLVPLTIGTATKILPPPPPSPLPQTLPVQQISWKLDSLPRGSYELICQGSITSLAAPASLQVQLGGQTLSLPLAKRHIANEPGASRLIRVGVIDLPDDLSNAVLTLSLETTGTPPAGPVLQLRQLLLTRAKPAPSSPP